MNELHLFAGAGGGILGGQLLGHTCVCAVEWDAYARRVLLARQRDGVLPRFPVWDDVQTFDGKPWRGRVDVVAGGFPCQDISAAGKGAGIDGQRSGMWRHMARIVGEVRPRYVLVENSPILTSRGLGVVLGDLAALGYDAEWCVLGASDAGAPHRRERIWIMAYAKMSNDSACPSANGSRERAQRKLRRSCGLSNDVADASSRRRPTHKLRARGNIVGLCHQDVADAAGSQDHAKREDCECERNAMGRKEQAAQQDKRAPDHDGSCGCGGTLADTNGSAAVSDAGGERGQLSAGRGLAAIEQPRSDSEARSSGRIAGEWWATEPDVGRVANGLAARVDRLRCIGNGQVPAVAALAWQTLIEQIQNRQGLYGA